MRYILLIGYVAAMLLLSISCTKNQLTTSTIAKERPENTNLILGKWELRQIVSDAGTLNYARGNKAYLEFFDSSYNTTNPELSIFVRGNHAKKGFYNISADTSVIQSTGHLVPSGEFVNRIILNGDTTGEKIFFQIDNNQLIILSGFFPLDSGVQLTFQKQ